MAESNLIAVEKAPGVHQVCIGEIIYHLLAKCVLLGIGTVGIEACGNLKLCVGLGAGIEGSVHATLKEYRNS